MLNMFPKFELVPISRYLSTFAKALRPAMMPACSTSSRRSSRMMSDASRATSTAPATEMPTSAPCSDGASLMPSPRKPDDVAGRLERAQDAQLLRRRDPREDVRPLGDARERRLVEALDLAAEHDAAAVDADLAADVRRHQLVVAADDLHGHAVLAEPRDRLARRLRAG